MSASGKNQQNSMRKLKVITSILDQALDLEILEAPSLATGIPRGAVVELLGPSRIAWFIEFLKLHPEFKVYWCERDGGLPRHELHRLGVNLTRVTFGIFGDDLKPQLQRVLENESHAVLLAPHEAWDLATFRSFQVLAAETNSTLFLLGQTNPTVPSSISLQLAIQPHPSAGFKVQVMRKGVLNS